MVEDNTPLIAAVSAASREQQEKRRKLRRFVDEMLESDSIVNQVYPEMSGDGFSVDTAVFYYPNIPDGIIVFGPISVKDMLAQFFRENLPSILPEAGKFKDLPVKNLADKALEHGMIVLFGNGGRLQQVMSKKGRVSLPDQGSAAEDVFDSADASLLHFTSFGVAKPNLVSISDIVPQLKWLATAGR